MLTKEYSLAQTRGDKLKAIFAAFKYEVPTFWALKGISFDVYSGETIGIIGVNGSGKSTLSNIISGITPQTSGQLDINGEVSIISIGSGLNDNLTGRENIRMKSLMMGEKNKQIDEKMDEIIEFSEIGVFIDQPVKTYSSGMRSKLGFSIAVHQDPDILVIDEALSVGDSTFYNKGLKKMLSFKEQGKTIFFVAQNPHQMRQICDKVIWMHYGEARAFGEKDEVLDQYVAFVDDYNKKSEEDKKLYQEEEKEKQRTYSLEQLQKEKLNESREKGAKRKDRNRIINSTTKNKIGDKMSIPMKFFTLFLLMFTMYLSVSYVKGVSVTLAILHPIKTIARLKAPTPAPLPPQANGAKQSNVPTKTTTSKTSSTKGKTSSKNTTKSSSKKSTSSTTSTTAPLKTQDYIVEQPDTLETLAAAYHITTAQLQEMNPTVDFVNLYIGQLIKVPLLEENTTANGATTNYIVQEGDSRSAIAERYGMTLEELEQLNPELNGVMLEPGQVLKIRGNN